MDSLFYAAFRVVNHHNNLLFYSNPDGRFLSYYDANSGSYPDQVWGAVFREPTGASEPFALESLCSGRRIIDRDGTLDTVEIKVGDNRSQYWTKIPGAGARAGKYRLQNVATERYLFMSSTGYGTTTDDEHDNQYWAFQPVPNPEFEAKVNNIYSPQSALFSQWGSKLTEELFSKEALTAHLMYAKGLYEKAYLQKKTLNRADFEYVTNKLLLLLAEQIALQIGKWLWNRPAGAMTMSLNLGYSKVVGGEVTLGVAVAPLSIAEPFVFIGPGLSIGTQVGPSGGIQIGLWKDISDVLGAWKTATLQVAWGSFTACTPLLSMNVTGIYVGFGLPGAGVVFEAGYWYGLNEWKDKRSYDITVTTGSSWWGGDGTDGRVYVNLVGEHGQSGYMLLDADFVDDFEAGDKRTYSVNCGNIGNVKEVRVKLGPTASTKYGFEYDAWKLASLKAVNPLTDHVFERTPNVVLDGSRPIYTMT